MIRLAVVAIDGNGETIVLSAHRFRWLAEIHAEAIRKVIARNVADPILRHSVAVNIESAGPRALRDRLDNFMPLQGRMSQ